MQEKNSNKKAVYPKVTYADYRSNDSHPANYIEVPPISAGIAVTDLFSIFTADIIRQDVIFIR